jgi:AraC family transcriptional regulator
MEGEYTETLADGEHGRRPGALVYYPRHAKHAELHHIDGRHLLIEVDPPWLDRHDLHLPDRESIALDRVIAGRLGQRLGRLFLAVDRASPLQVEELLLDLFLTVAEPTWARRSRPATWLKSVRDIIEATYRDGPTLVELASVAGVHSAHLTRCFRAEFGCTIGSYVRRLRLDFARRRICESDDPLSRVAADAGFADQSHLTREFRTHLGITPAALRRAAQRR